MKILAVMGTKRKQGVVHRLSREVLRGAGEPDTRPNSSICTIIISSTVLDAGTVPGPAPVCSKTILRGFSRN